VPKNTSPEDREVLKRVYEDQLRDWTAELDAVITRRDEAEKAVGELDDATGAYLQAVFEAGVLQGKMDALRALAARDGITDL